MKRKTNEMVDCQLIAEHIPLIRIGDYTNNYTKMQWKCTTCDGAVTSTADKILNAGVRCSSPECAKRQPITNTRVDSWLLPFQVSRVSNVTNISSTTSLICNTCGHPWTSTPKSIMLWKVKGCPNCLQMTPISNESIDAYLSVEAPSISRTESVGTAKTKISWLCNKCDHTWRTTPNRITSQGTRCPKCSKSCRWSRVAITWLTNISNTSGHHIQHAENGGEYRIPNTRLFVDGFCEQTNTVYEFYGDQWHGNPTLYQPSDMCHPFNRRITAGELYAATTAREQQIERLGYAIISIWEHEYHAI